MANLPLVALPYDRDSVLTALEKAAPPRPNTRALDSLFALWRGPFSQYARATFRENQFRDSLSRIHQRLDSLPRNSADYKTLYLHFAELTDSMSAAKAGGEPARRELDRMRETVLPRIDSLRRGVRAWENSTFRDYESTVRELGKSREPVADTTDPEGRAQVKVPASGRWWIYAWAWDEGDPYSQWYWNVPVTGDSAVLDATTGKKRPRY